MHCWIPEGKTRHLRGRKRDKRRKREAILPTEIKAVCNARPGCFPLLGQPTPCLGVYSLLLINIWLFYSPQNSVFWLNFSSKKTKSCGPRPFPVTDACPISSPRPEQGVTVSVAWTGGCSPPHLELLTASDPGPWLMAGATEMDKWWKLRNWETYVTGGNGCSWKQIHLIRNKEGLEQFWELMIASVYCSLYTSHSAKDFTYMISFAL